MGQKFGLLKNRTDKLQMWGSFEIAPGGIGRVPYEVIEGLRQHPSRHFAIVEDDPSLQLFIRTEHQPFNERYRRSK